MKFAIYGVSRSGKDYFIKKLISYFAERGKTLKHINGSTELNNLAGKKFSRAFKLCSDSEKDWLRKRFIALVNSEEKTNGCVVVDGHYAFYDKNGGFNTVCTEDDVNCYDKFFYIDTPPEAIVERMKNSEGEKKNDKMTAEQVRRWQNFEIENMTETLLKQDKELHVFTYRDDFALQYVFDCAVNDGYNSRNIARGLVDKLNIDKKRVILVDCDKTLSKEDSANLAFEYCGAEKSLLKDIFEGDRYSHYQLSLFSALGKKLNLFNGEAESYVLEKITPNAPLVENLNEIKGADIVAITAGNGKLWKKILNKFGLNIPVIAHENNLISKYVKYYVVKELQARKKYVAAAGDSLLDGLMLKYADKGYIVTAKGYRENIARFLAAAPQVKQLEYFPVCYPNAVEKRIPSIKILPPDGETEKLISVCKSGSKVCGAPLRRAHRRLGEKVAEYIAGDFPDREFTVIAAMRSGLPFAEGIADYLDCSVLFYDGENPTAFERQLNENPQLKGNIFILTDAVINSGKTVLTLSDMLSGENCVIATNVLSEKFNAFSSSTVYASRISEHSYIGAKQTEISGGKGPDTADRLFKLLPAAKN